MGREAWCALRKLPSDSQPRGPLCAHPDTHPPCTHPWNSLVWEPLSSPPKRRGWRRPPTHSPNQGAEGSGRKEPWPGTLQRLPVTARGAGTRESTQGAQWGGQDGVGCRSDPEAGSFSLRPSVVCPSGRRKGRPHGHRCPALSPLKLGRNIVTFS